jgi:hypothetical protein
LCEVFNNQGDFDGECKLLIDATLEKISYLKDKELKQIYNELKENETYG